MYSKVQSLGSNRIGVFADSYIENSFVVRNADMVYARINKIGAKWVVWFYKKHLQKSFEKLRDAISCINDDFIDWYRSKN